MKVPQRIKNAIDSGKVEFWESRPQNLSRELLLEAAERCDGLTVDNRSERKSGDGVYGLTGEDFVYSGKLTVSGFGVKKVYYWKLFFWEKDTPVGEQGIEIQSFKEWGNE